MCESIIKVGNILIIIGLLLVLFGILIKTGFQLPGDIVIKKENITFYFPVVTMILLSVVVSVVLWLMKK